MSSLGWASLDQSILIIGGTGFFGRLLADDLKNHGHCRVIIGARRRPKASGFETVAADLVHVNSLQRALDGVSVAICAAGPYQSLPTSLAELCLERGIHYIDLADDREFVRKVRTLASAHPNSAGAVCTGWSTAPALSAALAQIAARGMERIDTIRIHMAPGNRGARRYATIASLMHSVGRPFTVLRNGEWISVRGWTEPRDFDFPLPIARRRGYLVDVPDHEIFPAAFGARTVEFRAGSELDVLNRALSLLARTGRNWVGWSGPFQRTAALFSRFGRDSGAIGVEVRGSFTRRASIVARSKGERIAVMPASVMANALTADLEKRGLVPYTDWITEDQLMLQCEQRGFHLVVEEG